MSLLRGLQIIRKRRVSVASTLLKESLAMSTVGIVHSIASVIQNKDVIKGSRSLKSAFSKMEIAAYKATRPGATSRGVNLDEEESSILRQVGEIAKESLGSVVRIASTHLARSMGHAFQLAIIPVFRIFCATVTTVFRLILANPYTLAATAIIVAAIGGRKMWLNYREDKYRGGPSSLPDLPAPSAPTTSSGAAASPGGSAPRSPNTQQSLQMQQVIADAAKRNGVPIELAVRVATIESSLNPNSGSSSSSAKGLFGITKGTWKGLGGKPGEELDPKANADLGTKYLHQNYVAVKKGLGREVATYEVYAAHFFGPGVVALLRVQDTLRDQPIEKGLAKFNSAEMVKKIMQQNPNLRGKTVGQVIDWLKMKAGDKSMAEASRADPAEEARIASGPVVGTGSMAIPAAGTFTSPFGKRTFKGPRGMVSGDHKGIDIANGVGTPIYAADAGIVTVSSTASAGYGTRIDIDHGNGLLTRYGHSSKLFVREGEAIRKGQHIAAMGNAGFSSGPHLHFEVRTTTASGPSAPVDPVPYLPGFPSTKNAMVSTTSVSTATDPEQKQYIRRGSKIVAIRGG